MSAMLTAREDVKPSRTERIVVRATQLACRHPRKTLAAFGTFAALGTLVAARLAVRVLFRV